MSYLGNAPALAYTSFVKQDFIVTTTTSYSLDHPVANENEIALFINFVRQEPSTSYSASGSTLTLTEATSVGDDMYCVFLGKAVQTVNPPNSSVGTSQLVDGSVTSAKLSAGKILQVVSTTKTDEFASSLSSGSSIAVTGLSVDITPTSTSNKILVMCSVNGHNGSEGGGTFTIKRDSTEILIPSSGTGVEASITGLGISSDSSPLTLTIHGIDLPSSTSQLTYSVTMTNTSALTRTCSVNATDGTEQMRGCSTITLMEIAG